MHNKADPNKSEDHSELHTVQSRDKISPFKGSPTVSPVAFSCACLNLCLGLIQGRSVFLRIVHDARQQAAQSFPTKILQSRLRIINVSRDTDQGCSGIGSRTERFKCLHSCRFLSSHKTPISLINSLFSARRASLISRRL